MADPTELQTRPGAGMVRDFPFQAPERSPETLFHPQPPTNARFQSIDIGGTGQAIAAATKTQFTQAWGQFLTVFSTPRAGMPGNNPGGVNVTQTAPSPAMPAEVSKAAGGVKSRWNWRNAMSAMFPNG